MRPCAASWKSSSLWRSSSASWTWRTSPSLTAPPWSPNLPATTTSATTSVRLSSRGECAQMNECVNIHIHIYIYLCAAMHLLTVFNPDTPPPVSVLKHLHEKTLRTDTNTHANTDLSRLNLTTPTSCPPVHVSNYYLQSITDIVQRQARGTVLLIFLA